MDNTENLTNDECACSIDYEAAYRNAMKELDATAMMVADMIKNMSTSRKLER